MNTKKAHKESDWRTQERERAIGVIQRERVRPHKKKAEENSRQKELLHTVRGNISKEKKKFKGEEKR